MNARPIDASFSVSGQITPADVKAIAAAGFRSILCARPDNEEPGQPAFADIAQAAKASGLEIVHIPVSGPLGPGQAMRFREAWQAMPKPMLGYCRSGARAGSLYATL
jgi:uncharacterized protein (TIGR01244 family)